MISLLSGDPTIPLAALFPVGVDEAVLQGIF